MENSDELANVLLKWAEVFNNKSIGGLVCFGKEHGLSISQIGALFHLNHGRISSVSQIGDSLGITSAAASQMLDGLLRQGLIVRHEDPDDRRSKQIALTRQGTKIIHNIMKARQHWFSSISNRMTREERKIVINSLNILIEKAEQPASDRNQVNNFTGIKESINQ
ncbi:MAG: hypothetical protein DRP57_04460 [Spirochaetes bacterium]|nr:MAG: hypothetical protein DRP57_04460 [Spirochaetota bacterium]